MPEPSKPQLVNDEPKLKPPRSVSAEPLSAPKPQVTRLKQLWSRYGALSFGFFVYLVISLVALWLHPPTWSDGAWDALVIGLLVNAIFALTVGVVSALVAVVKPEEQLFDTRLWFLFPESNHLTESSRRALKEGATRLAAPTVRGSIHVTVVEVEREPKPAFKISVGLSFILKNLLRNEVYEDAEYQITIVPDEVEKDRIGNVHFVHFRCNGNVDTPFKEVPIERGDKRFMQPLPIRIPKGLEGEIEYSYWAWALGGVPWAWTVRRYTEHLDFTLKNTSGVPINFEISVTEGRNTGVVTLRNSGVLVSGEREIKLPKLALQPGSSTLSLNLAIDEGSKGGS